MMTGVMLVMGACMFGGLTAVLLMALGQRDGALAVALAAAAVVVAGIAIQVVALRKMKAAKPAAKGGAQ